MKIPRAPAGLEATGRRFWKKVLGEFSLVEQHDLERLLMACKCLDDIEQCERVTEQEGRFVKDRFQQMKEHPAAKAAREHKMLFIRILRELALDIAVIPDTRIPRRY